MPRFIVFSISRVTSLGAAAPGISTAPITTSAFFDRMGDRRARGVSGLDLAAEEHVQFGQAGVGDVVDGDVGAHADRHLRRVDARDAAAEDHHPRRRDAGNAAEQHAAPALLLLQIMGADLDRHPPGDLAHRLEERQRAVARGHRLISDAGRAGLDQALGLVGIGGEMEIGEEQMARLQQGDLARLRLLHLHDHVGLGEDLGGIGGDASRRPRDNPGPRSRCPRRPWSRRSPHGRRRPARRPRRASARRDIRGP